MTTQPRSVRNEHTRKTKGGELGDPCQNYAAGNTERGKETRQPLVGTWEVAMKRSDLLLDSQRESGENRDRE